MASFFDINIETPQEAQERLRQEMLAGLAQNQRQSALQGIGYALAQAGGQAAQKWGGVVPEPVRIAQETERVVQDGLGNYNTRMANRSESGEDPLLIQSEEFIKAAAALRSVNPQASREFMQKAVETRQAYEEQRYSRGRLAASDKRAEEKHAVDLGSSVDGINMLLEQAQNIKDPAVKEKRVAELNERKEKLLREDPNYQQVELADGIYWINKSDPNDRHYIGPVYRMPTKAGDTDAAAATAAAAGADALTPLETTLNQFAEHAATMGVATGKGVGPLEGRVPGAMAGENARSFDSMSNELAVLLKPLIRGKGEGTWTDKDQAILDRLVPQRVDDPATIQRKLANIKAMIENRRRMAGTIPATSRGATGTWGDEQATSDVSVTWED